MEKANLKAREYRFFSQKNQKMICLHSEQALAYARYLEDRLWVAAYDACVPLELTDQIDPWGIRPLYFKTAWVSDFRLVYADGKQAVRELVRLEDLEKQAVIERLELSRRYWMGWLKAIQWNGKSRWWIIRKAFSIIGILALAVLILSVMAAAQSRMTTAVQPGESEPPIICQYLEPREITP